jgi:hypothetical protein
MDPRVGVRVSVKVSTGNYGSVGLELSEERDVSGVADEKQTRQAILRRLEMELEAFKAQHTELPKPIPTPLPTVPAFTLPTVPKPALTPVTPQAHTPVSTEITIEPGSVAAVTDQNIEDELNKLDWIDNSKRSGWFAPLEEIPLTVRAALVNKFLKATGKSVRIGGHNYTRFGEDNGLIGKFKADKGTAK